MTDSELAQLVPMLRGRTQAGLSPRIFYDGMSDALIWSDEVEGLPAHIIWSLRPIFHARSCLIAGQSVKYLEQLAVVRQVCGHWIGFRDDRMRPSAPLAALLASERARFHDDIDRWDLSPDQ